MIYYFVISRLLILACLGRRHGATILDRIMRNETANPTSPPAPSKSWMKPHHFPVLVWRGGGINFPSISYKHRRQPGGILNINYSRLRDEIPAPGSSVPRTLVKAKLRRQTSEGQRDLQWISSIFSTDQILKLKQ